MLRQWQRLEERDRLKQELAAEQSINESLREEIRLLGTDDLAIEQAVREQLDLQRPGEVVLITGDSDPLRRRDPSITAPPRPAGSSRDSLIAPTVQAAEPGPPPASFVPAR